jgi:hypothetical protein
MTGPDDPAYDFRKAVYEMLCDNTNSAAELYDLSIHEIDQAVSGWIEELREHGLEISTSQDAWLVAATLSIVWGGIIENLSTEDCPDMDHVLTHVARGMTRVSWIARSRWDLYELEQ